jgi:pseudomonalisin
LRHLAAPALLGLALAGSAAVWAQSPPEKRALITQRIDETELVTLPGNIHPAIGAATDRGILAADTMLNHMVLQLNRAPEVQQAAENLAMQLRDPNSPQFHHWLTLDEIGERFGPADEDVHTVSRWLASHGFIVNFVHPASGVVDFSGTAGAVRDAFHTQMHHLLSNGRAHIANMSDPQIPAALAPAIRGIVYLHDFKPRPVLRQRPHPYAQRRARVLFTFNRESMPPPQAP